MKVVTATITQMAVLGVLALVIGLGVNAVRGKNHINLQRDYRPKLPNGPSTQPAAPTADGSEASPDEQGPAEAVAAAQPEAPTEESPFQVVTLDEVIKIFNDETTSYGLNVFVDARADREYEAGHIPGAVQCDYYRRDFYLGQTLAAVAGAAKVIVYCNGHDCADSLNVCGLLLESDALPWDAIYLFKGGWEEWSGRDDLPIETGRPGGTE